MSTNHIAHYCANNNKSKRYFGAVLPVVLGLGLLPMVVWGQGSPKPEPAYERRVLLSTVECEGTSNMGVLEVGTKASVSDTIVVLADQPAMFKDKEAPAFLDWVKENIRLPSDGASGSAVIVFSFVVDADGLIRVAELTRGAHPTLDKEVLRVVKSSPKWTPAKHQGKQVRQKFTMLLRFSY